MAEQSLNTSLEADDELDIIRRITEKIIDLENRVKQLESLETFNVTIKTTTGDPATGVTGNIVVNTVDNNIKAWADSAWRSLASW